MMDEQLDYWADAFARLNRNHRLSAEHGYTLVDFLRNPAHDELWIRVYFGNLPLLKNRRHQARISLQTFLQNSPDRILLIALNADQQQRDELADHKRLLPRQREVVRRLFDVDVYYAQEQADLIYERTHTVEHRGVYYIEPFHRHDWCKKWKTRGCHVSRA